MARLKLSPKKRIHTALYFIFLCLFMYIQQLKAEGTKTISPTNTNCTALTIDPSFLAGPYLGCGEDNRNY